MIDKAKVKKMLSIADKYAADGCYGAADRQVDVIKHQILEALADEDRFDAVRFVELQEMARMVVREIGPIRKD